MHSERVAWVIHCPASSKQQSLRKGFTRAIFVFTIFQNFSSYFFYNLPAILVRNLKRIVLLEQISNFRYFSIKSGTIQSCIATYTSKSHTIQNKKGLWTIYTALVRQGLAREIVEPTSKISSRPCFRQECSIAT